MKSSKAFIVFVVTASMLLSFVSVASSAASGVWTETKVQFGGYEREYALYVPANWERGGALFVFFHGFSLGFTDYRKGSGLLEAADKYQTAVLMPNALPIKLKSAAWLLNPRVWDMGQVEDRNEFIDDATFVDDLISETVAQIGADNGRVFLAGHSNGAFFAHYLAGRFPGRFAGIASITGRFYKATMPKVVEPIPTVIINGMLDPVLPIEGIKGSRPQQNVPAAQENIELWVSLMGLEPEPVKEDIPQGGYKLSYKDALGRVMVVAVYVDKQGHWVPGATPVVLHAFFSGPINMSYKAFDEAWGMLLGAGKSGIVTGKP